MNKHDFTIVDLDKYIIQYNKNGANKDEIIKTLTCDDVANISKDYKNKLISIYDFDEILDVLKGDLIEFRNDVLEQNKILLSIINVYETDADFYIYYDEPTKTTFSKEYEAIPVIKYDF